MRTTTIGFAFLLGTTCAFFACKGEEPGPGAQASSSSGAGGIGGAGGAGPAPQCQGIYYLGGTCDDCLREKCCVELADCGIACSCCNWYGPESCGMETDLVGYCLGQHCKPACSGVHEKWTTSSGDLCPPTTTWSAGVGGGMSSSSSG